MFPARLEQGHGFHSYHPILPEILYNAIRWERTKATPLEREYVKWSLSGNITYTYAENSKSCTKTLCLPRH